MGGGNETKKGEYVEYLSKAAPSLVGNFLVVDFMVNLCLMDKVTSFSELVKSHWNAN